MDNDEEELRETFDYFDRDHNNGIDLDEFGELLDALGADMSASEKKIGFSAIDSDGNGTIEYDEFRRWWSDR